MAEGDSTGNVNLSTVTIRGRTSVPALSGLGSARFYFDEGLNKLQVSQNGGAYGDMVGGGGGGGTPGGASTNVQVNVDGAFDGSAGLTFVKATGVLTVATQIAVGLAGGSLGEGSINGNYLFLLPATNLETFDSQTLIVQQVAAAQTSNLAEFWDHANAVLLAIDKTGVIFPGVAGAIALGKTTNPFSGVLIGGASGHSANLTGTFTGNRTVTFPDSDTKISIAAQVLTFAGPTASRTITFPDASITVARTDAANTFTGHQTIEGVTSTGATGTGKLVFDTAPTFTTSITIGAGSAITSSGPGGALGSNAFNSTAFGTGTVTSIATTSPISGGAITTTGTISLLVNVDHAFTHAQTITDSSAASLAIGPAGNTNPVLRVVSSTASQATGVSVTGSAAGTAPIVQTIAAAQTASTTAGAGLAITADAAIAGSTNAGAAAGGAVTITGGAAAQKTSGNANGGAINLNPGAGIGTGVSGNVVIGGGVVVGQAGSTSAVSFGLGAVNTGIYSRAGSRVTMLSNGLQGIEFDGSTIYVASGAQLLFLTGALGTGTDLASQRSAAGLLEINNGTLGTWRDLKVRQYFVDATLTGGGTTGNQTINKSGGSVRIAAAGNTVTVTNSLCTTNSLVFAMVATNDTTALVKNVVPGSGSFVITMNANVTAETEIRWFVVNN